MGYLNADITRYSLYSDLAQYINVLMTRFKWTNVVTFTDDVYFQGCDEDQLKLKYLPMQPTVWQSHAVEWEILPERWQCVKTDIHSFVFYYGPSTCQFISFSQRHL